MDPSTELLARLQTLHEISSHHVRASEHAVLERLLYKNRSQHRHGSYFRRLEHVRRAAQTCSIHQAWATIQAMLNPKRGRCGGPAVPLSFSSVDVQDLEDLHKLLHHLTTRVIPVAASTIVNQLVIRGHFIHFSMAVIAVLARLFVIEQKICTELEASAGKMRIMLALSDLKEFDVLEDVGELLQPDELFGVASTDDTPHLQSPAPWAVDAPSPTSIPSPQPSLANHAQPRSLYDLIAPDDSQAAKIVEAIADNKQAECVAPPLAPFGRPSRSESVSQVILDSPNPSPSAKMVSNVDSGRPLHSKLSSHLENQERLRSDINMLPGCAKQKRDFAKKSQYHVLQTREDICDVHSSLLRSLGQVKDTPAVTSEFPQEPATGCDGEEDIDNIFMALE